MSQLASLKEPSWTVVIYIDVNDLKTCTLDEVKFVDDLTVSETVTRLGSSNIQHAVSEVEECF